MSIDPLGYAMVLINALSAASIVLAGAILFRWLRGSPHHPSRCFLVAVLTVELPLFIFSGFHLTLTDPYSAGYRGMIVPALMAAMILIGWLRNNVEILLWIGLAALLYVIRIYDTPNLWDYLVDPFAGLVALIWLITTSTRKLSGRRSSQSPPARPQDS